MIQVVPLEVPKGNHSYGAMGKPNMSQAFTYSMQHDSRLKQQTADPAAAEAHTAFFSSG